MKIREKGLNFSKLPFYLSSAIRSAKVTCNFNILLVATRILLLPERCHVMIYWAAFSALYLQIPWCVTCRGEGLAELLQGELWVPGLPWHSQEVACSVGSMAVQWLEKSPACFSQPWSLATKHQTQNLGKYLLSEVASCLRSTHIVCVHQGSGIFEYDKVLSFQYYIMMVMLYQIDVY